MIPPRPRHNIQISQASLLVITTGLVGLGLWNYWVFLAALPATPTEPYAVSIPWLQDQITCEKTDRFWHNEQCWDSQHDPNF